MFLKDDFNIVGLFIDLLFGHANEPIEILLQSQTAGEQDISSIILTDFLRALFISDTDKTVQQYLMACFSSV